MKTQIFTLLIMSMALSVEAQEKRRGGPGQWQALYESKEHDGASYRLMKPVNFDAEKSYPVIVSLHGAGGKGTDNRKQLKGWNKQLAQNKTRTQYPCYVLAPQAPTLWAKTDLHNIQSIIKTLPSVDMNRIYIMGHSMGGHGTYIMIQLAPKYFAAAAPSAGSGLRSTEKFIDPSLIKDIRSGHFMVTKTASVLSPRTRRFLMR